MRGSIFPALYDSAMAPAERGRVGRWRRSLFSQATGRVVEIGAGTGLDFAHYPPGSCVVATDPDVGMLYRARSRATDARAEILLVAADAEALPFRDDSFDTGAVGLALCTIPNPERALSELSRTIVRNGRLLLLEHVRFASPALGLVQDVLTPVWRRLAGGCRLNRRTVEIVARSGFTLESVTPHLGGYVQEIVARVPPRA